MVEYVPPPTYNLEIISIDPAVGDGWRTLKEKCEGKFSMLQSAFRRMDEDKSGKLNHFEVHKILHDFNLGLGHKVIDQLISIADHDGDGEIDWQEFIRFLKNGVPDNAAEMLANQKDQRAEARRRAQEEAEKNTLRTCQQLIKKRIETKFGSTSLRSAFRQIDEDKSGKLSDVREPPAAHHPLRRPLLTCATSRAWHSRTRSRI